MLSPEKKNLPTGINEVTLNLQVKMVCMSIFAAMEVVISVRRRQWNDETKYRGHNFYPLVNIFRMNKWSVKSLLLVSFLIHICLFFLWYFTHLFWQSQTRLDCITFECSRHHNEKSRFLTHTHSTPQLTTSDSCSHWWNDHNIAYQIFFLSLLIYHIIKPLTAVLDNDLRFNPTCKILNCTHKLLQRNWDLSRSSLMCLLRWIHISKYHPLFIICVIMRRHLSILGQTGDSALFLVLHHGVYGILKQ